MRFLMQLAMLCLFVFLTTLVFHQGVAIGIGVVMVVVWWIGAKKRVSKKVSKREMVAMGLMAFITLGIAFLGYLISQPTSRKNKASSMIVDANALKSHVTTLSQSYFPRSYHRPDNLDKCANYILDHFNKANASDTEIQVFEVGGESYKNIRAFFGSKNQPRIIVEAHYDSHENTPGADDNASGVTGLIELAYLLGQHPVKRPIELVAFCLEEPPFFGSEQMGSAYHTDHDTSIRLNYERMADVLVSVYEVCKGY